MSATTSGSPHDAHGCPAQVMVAKQVGCTLDRALEIMRDTAQATDESLEQIAAEVVARNIRFDNDESN